MVDFGAALDHCKNAQKSVRSCSICNTKEKDVLHPAKETACFVKLVSKKQNQKPAHFSGVNQG